MPISVQTSQTVEQNNKKDYKPVFLSLAPGNCKDADRFTLRRNVGRSICEAEQAALSAFYGNVDCRRATDEEEKAFFIACLYCEQGENGKYSLPQAWGLHIKEKGGNGDRFLSVADMPWGKAAERTIIRAVRLLRREGYSIDFERLYFDIRHWNEFKTRSRWARVYSITINHKEEKKK